MPRTVHSNGVKSEIKALAVMQLNKPFTPQEVNDHVKTGDYAAKYVSMLTNTYGFKFTTQRDGRRVVTYTMVGEPANAAALRAMTPPAAKTKVVAAPKIAKTASAPIVKSVAPKTTTAVKKAATKVIARKQDPVEKEFGSSGAVGSIDADWDSIDGLNIKQLS